jgi:hypothetical protein
MSNNNQDLIEIVKDNQKDRRITQIIMIIQGLGTLVTIVLFIRGHFQKKKSSIKERMMREEEIIARAQLRLKRLKKEAEHEAELNQLKSGLNSLDDLQEKGEELIQNQAEQVKKGIDDKIKGLKDKF